MLNYILNFNLMNPLVSSGFSHYQDTLQTGSKLFIVINIDIDQYGEKNSIIIFAISFSPTSK